MKKLFISLTMLTISLPLMAQTGIGSGFGGFGQSTTPGFNNPSVVPSGAAATTGNPFSNVPGATTDRGTGSGLNGSLPTSSPEGARTGIGSGASMTGSTLPISGNAPAASGNTLNGSAPFSGTGFETTPNAKFNSGGTGDLGTIGNDGFGSESAPATGSGTGTNSFGTGTNQNTTFGSGTGTGTGAGGSGF